MAYCTKCGTKLDDEELYCHNCGTRRVGFNNSNIETNSTTVLGKSDLNASKKIEYSTKYSSVHCVNKKNIKIIVGTIICLILIISVICLYISNENMPVSFNDKNLEQVVRKSINIPTGVLHKKDVEKITKLKVPASVWNIEDISGIENLTNLESLSISCNKISDISALKNLTNLKQLYLGYNRIKDISVLKSLTNLELLNLTCNEVTDDDIDKLIKNSLPKCSAFPDRK